MTISRIVSQDAHNEGAGFSSSATYPGATTANNLLICVATGGTTGNITVSGFTRLVSQNIDNSNRVVQLFYKLAAGTESTITASTGAGPAAIDIFEYTGNANPITTDGTAAGSGGNSGASISSLATASITTVNANDLIFTVLCADGGTISSPSWTSAAIIGSNLTPAIGLFCGENIVSATQSSYSDTASWTTGETAGTLIAAFQAAGSGTPATVNFVKAPTVMVMR